MTEQRFQDCLYILLESVGDNSDAVEDWDGDPIEEVRSFEDEGMLTNNKGLVVQLEDGSEFQLTIVRSKSRN